MMSPRCLALVSVGCLILLGQAFLAPSLYAVDYDAAYVRIEAALVEEPTSDRLKMELVQALFYREKSPNYAADLRRALKLLEESIRLHEGIPKMEKQLSRRHFYAGMALWYLNQSEQALAAFDRSYRLNPAMLPALYNSITILEELGRNEEARLRKQTYRQIAKYDPF